MFSMNLSAPVVAKAEADAGAYTVGQAAHDPGLIKLLRHRLVELAWFPDDDVVNRFNVGGTKECAGPLPGSPPSARFHLCGVGPSAPRLRFVVLSAADPAPPCPPTMPLAHLQCLLPRVPSSHMPPTPTSSPVSLLKKGTYLMKSDTKVKMFNQGTQKNNHGTFM